MKVEELQDLFNEDPRVQELLGFLEEENTRIQLKGLCGSADAMVAAAVLKKNSAHHLFILNDREEAAYFQNDLESFLGKNKALYYPASARAPYQEEKTDNANVLMRAEVLNAIQRRKRGFAIVTYPEALLEKVVTKKHLEKNTLNINLNDTLSLDFINELLFEYEFERVDFVTQPGEFSIRGGIVDIFSFSNDHPYRVEFFGDEVDSIRTFDPSSQLSVQEHAKISIVPNVQKKLLHESRDSFPVFLPKETVVWVRDYTLTMERVGQEFEKTEEAFEKLNSPVDHLPPEELFCHAEQLAEDLAGRSLIEFGNQFLFRSENNISFRQTPQPVFHKNFELLSKNLEENSKVGVKNLILASSSRQIERLYHIFEDIGKEVRFTPILLNLHEGFRDQELKIACYTDHQIFERFHRYRLKEGFKKSQKAITIKELTDLQPGDFVVHIDHGVGQFAGLQKIENNGKEQEVIRIKYKDTDTLFVSIHSLHRISKYSGKEGTQPRVNKLGSNAWANLKQKTKKKVKEIAYDLIKLYAKRKAQKGFAFAPDTYLQHELEASFLFEDTPDQDKSTKAVKADMEQVSPMDRLVCGDVGFGKTEIAVRAAFKAVTDSKQVAVLVPTTILALQHYHTFKNRLKDFPCNVDYINRFKSAKEQKETLRKLSTGEVDIVIGTHRLAGKDVKFKDLGLMIIDEEQKFGVAVKDKLKTMKVNIDTLTLTATPIPRTLQFSLMGARDLSIINTPPPNRQPVVTELHTFNEDIIRDAIFFEISRQGQVFFVHNRVQNIAEVDAMIQRLCPGVKTGVAHGQMDGAKLEDIMLQFIEGEFDVLISTTIIESGLDIPNANTIIINQANMFGLSDLHQMRGRVGRSNKRAFCYLLSPPLSTMTPEARKRLKAIEQFSDLGSGFNIAMRDLDIRGAGNLLGGEQSGFISEIGFDMYHKILDEALEELKETEFKDLFKKDKVTQYVKDCQIDTDMEIMLPDTYVNNITERLSLYNELSNITQKEHLAAYEKNLIDRFGPLPDQAGRLLSTIRLRWIAKDIGLEKIVLKANKMICYFVTQQDSPYYQSPEFGRVLEFVKHNIKRVVMKEKNRKLSLTFQNISTVEEAIAELQPIFGEEVAS